MKLNGYEFQPSEIRGNCSIHGTPLINAPQASSSIVMDKEIREAFTAGLWGVGYCPVFRHFEVWYLPPVGERPFATESDPLGFGRKIPLDKIDPFA